jgi:hypothetical protein
MADETAMIGPSAPARHLWPADRTARGRAGTRAISCLRHGGIATVGELAAATARDIGDIPGAGAATVAEVRRVLARHGLALKDDGTEAAEIPARARVLAHAGLRRSAALRFARESWPSGEIAPGVVLTVAGESRG